MKFYLILAFCLMACGHITSPDDFRLESTFTLTDTVGQSTTLIHSGENFYLSFLLTNTTNDTLTYYRGSSAPPVLFRILRGDNIIASSIDGYAFLQYISTGILAPGQKIDTNWKAPTTPAQYHKVILKPGRYQAVALSPNFNEAETKKASPIYFDVID